MDVSLLFATIGLGVVSIAATALLARVLVTPVAFYWTGWFFGISAAESLSGDGLMPVFEPAGRGLILHLHVAAVIGFVLAALAYRLFDDATGASDGSAATLARSHATLHLDRRLVATAFLLQFVIGMVLLGYRIQQVAGVGGIASLVDIRQSYLRAAFLVERLPPIERLGHHSEVLLSIVPFLFAFQDALDGRPRWQRILLWWIAAAPSGISTGGRGWIVAAPMLYAITYLTVARRAIARVTIRRWTLRGAAVLVTLVALFGYYERARSTEEAANRPVTLGGPMRWYDRVPLLTPVLYYMGLPTLAVAAHSCYASELAEHRGALSFPFVTSQLRRLGFSFPDRTEFVRNSRGAMFTSPYPILGATHATIVPSLIGDFGAGWWLAMIAISFLVLLSFLILRDRGIIARLIAVQLILFGGFWVFQEFMLGMSAAVLPVVWLAVLLATDRIAYDSYLTSARMVELRRVVAPGASARERLQPRPVGT